MSCIYIWSDDAKWQSIYMSEYELFCQLKNQPISPLLFDGCSLTHFESEYQAVHLFVQKVHDKQIGWASNFTVSCVYIQITIDKDTSLQQQQEVVFSPPYVAKTANMPLNQQKKKWFRSVCICIKQLIFSIFGIGFWLDSIRLFKDDIIQYILYDSNDQLPSLHTKHGIIIQIQFMFQAH